MFVNSEFGKVAFIEEYRSDKVVILGHGYLSDKRSRTNRALLERLTSSNLSVIAYDMWGHGESEGDVRFLTTSKAVASARAVYKYASKKYKKIALVGSSFTGPVSLITAYYERLDALALKCPVFDPKALWEERFSKERLEQWEREGFIKLFNTPWHYGVYNEARFLDMRSVAEAISCPVFVVHGDKDVTVPLSHARQIASLTGGELKVISGADHFFKEPQHFSQMLSSLHKWLVEVLE